MSAAGRAIHLAGDDPRSAREPTQNVALLASTPDALTLYASASSRDALSTVTQQGVTSPLRVVDMSLCVLRALRESLLTCLVGPCAPSIPFCAQASGRAATADGTYTRQLTDNPVGRRDAAVREQACAEVTRRQTQHRRTGAPTAAMIRRSCAIVLAIALHGVPAAAQAPLPPVAPQVACAVAASLRPAADASLAHAARTLLNTATHSGRSDSLPTRCSCRRTLCATSTKSTTTEKCPRGDSNARPTV